MAEIHINGPKGRQRLALDLPELFLGRDPSTHVVLDDPKVSRKHARLYLRGGHYWVEDLGSSNGVLVKGAAIPGPHKLVHDAHFSIGPFVLHFTSDARQPQSDGNNAAVFGLVGLTAPCEGKTYLLPEGDIDVGRAEDAAIFIPDPSISRTHAILKVTAKTLIVEDQNSSNGTFVDKIQVGRRELKPGERLRFGSVAFEVSAEGRSPGYKVSGAFGWFRRLDTPIRAAVVMGAVTVVLSLMVLFVLLGRVTPLHAQPSPFVAYEQRITDGLTQAQREDARELWDAAARTYQAVLDQDPINPVALRGVRRADINQKHKEAIDTARAAVQAGQLIEVLANVAPIDASSYYGTQAEELKRYARKTLAVNALNASQKACQQKQWRVCHQHAIEILTYQPKSAQGAKLIEQAERSLKKSRLSFVPWARQLEYRSQH